MFALSNFSAILVLVLALLALAIVIHQIRKRKRGTFRLERDVTGFWRYHKDTVFEKRLAFEKVLKKNAKGHGDEESRGGPVLPVAVVNFHGDMRAKHHRSFAELVDEIEINRGAFSEVVVVITSGGGLVSQYGLLYSQMERVRSLGLRLVVCIDVVAASGGYLMSLPADKIIAAPFSVVGSVGVVAFVPNFRKLLLDWSINPRTFTAGKYKRTVSLTDEAKPEEVERFQHQLEVIHRLFIEALKKWRPQAKLPEVETGAHWTAQESLELNLGLVDQVGTSNQYLLEINRGRDLVVISQHKSFWEEGLSLFASEAASGIMRRLTRSPAF